MKSILFICLAVLLFASCTGRRYGHYSYVKKKEKIAVGKENQRKQLPAVGLAAKLPLQTPVIMQLDTQPAKKMPVISRTERKSDYKSQKTNVNKQPTNDIPEKKRLNTSSVISALAAALSVAFLVGPAGIINLTFWLVAFVMALFSLIMGIKALIEIKKNKESGAVLATISIITSIVVLLVIAAVIAFILLIFGIIL